MAEGMMSRPPTGGGLKELSARQQRRKQYLERRGREFKPSGQVSGQPTEMPEMTARQQRRQQYLARRDARRQRAVEDYRAQQQAQQMPPNSFRSDNPQDPNIYSQSPDGSIVGTYMSYPGMSAGGPTFNEMKMLDTGNTASLAWQMTPEQAERARTMFSGGSGGQGYGNMIGQLPAGVSQGEAVGAAVQEPERLPSPAMLNNMPGQPFGQYTAAGQYRPLPFYATPQQIRERQALIQGGHYFNQLPPAQRMR
jgi:hypothetical protein